MKILYQCEWCDWRNTIKHKVSYHELGCLHNPANKKCPSCKHYISYPPDKDPQEKEPCKKGYYIPDVMANGQQCGTWTDPNDPEWDEKFLKEVIISTLRVERLRTYPMEDFSHIVEDVKKDLIEHKYD